MSFPTSLDNLSIGLNANATLAAQGHTALHIAERNAINALEAKVGADGSEVQTTHDYKLSTIGLGDKAVSLTGTETVTNKTFRAPKIDEIVEETGAHGVTIDGLNIKDGKLNTNDSVVTNNITDSAVTTNKINSDAVTPAKLLLGQDSAFVATEQTETSTSYDDMTTAGPTITYSPTVNTTVLLLYSADITNNTAGNYAYISPSISGATTDAAADSRAAGVRASGTNAPRVQASNFYLVTLTAGDNTIKLQYRVDGGTGTFANRRLVMIPLG